MFSQSATTAQIPATYSDSGEPCVVAITSDIGPIRQTVAGDIVNILNPPRTFRVGRQIVDHRNPDECVDQSGRVIRADIPGAFGRK